MYIKSVRLNNFRNYKDETAVFPHGRLVICGQNAQGKTNLLEAVYYLSSARPFRAADVRDLIRHGESSAWVEATVALSDREIELRVEFDEKGRRLFVNGVRERRAVDFAGRLKTVLFVPSDLSIVQSGAAERRRFMDLAISQVRPRYAEAVERYGKLHVGKTRILRDDRMSAALDTYNIKIAELSAIIMGYRARYVARVAEYAAQIHAEMTDGAERLEVSYKSSVSDATVERDVLAREIMEQIRQRTDEEKRRGLALVGAHRDDMRVEINGKAARKYASQGQARTAAVALKLGERRLLAESSSVSELPVLLLDDVLSELDADRREYITSAEHSGQMLITACEPSVGAACLTIQNGRII